MMTTGGGTSLETKWAMFWAALVAQCANETFVTANRIVASLTRTDSVRAFLSRAQIDAARVLEAIEELHTLSFDECARRVECELASTGIELGSANHRARVQLRPIEPVARAVFDKVIEQHGHIGVSPLELLLDLLRADPVLASRLAPLGLADAIRTELEE